MRSSVRGVLYRELEWCDGLPGQSTNAQRAFLLQFMEHIGEETGTLGLQLDIAHHIPALDATIHLFADEQHHAQHGDAKGHHELGANGEIGETPLHGPPKYTSPERHSKVGRNRGYLWPPLSGMPPATHNHERAVRRASTPVTATGAWKEEAPSGSPHSTRRASSPHANA
jgi:hypothetical protein